VSGTLLSFLRPHQALLLVLVLAVAAGASWLLRDRLGSRARMLAFFGLAVSVGVMLQLTLLRDGLPGGVCLECLAQWNTDRAATGAIGQEAWLNVAMFVPLGFLGTFIWRHPVWVTLLAAGVSVGVESLQALFEVGVSDLLDVAANSFGALIGAWLATVLLLARDAAATKRVDRQAFAGLVGMLLATVVVAWAGSTLIATLRQADLARRLEERFAGTTLTDYRRWEAPELPDAAVFSVGTPWATGAARDDSMARVRFPASFLFSERCVLGTWDAGGFSASPAAGQPCTEEPLS
jgi:hypothetical protein